ncbi:MAG: hypothetical protein WC294_11095 [Methanoregula sp.]
MTGEPTRSEHRRGVWGTCGQVSTDQRVFFFVSGEALLRLHPELTSYAKKYLRPGAMWEVTSQGRGVYRRLRLQLTHWNITNPRTDPKCKEIYLTLREECEGVGVLEPKEHTGETAAKV